MNSEMKTIDSVRDRINKLRSESCDHYYTQYLTDIMNDLDLRRVSLEYVNAELDRTYRLYLERMNQTKPEAIKSTFTDGTEYAIGTIALSIVGALFLLVSFITFGLNYLAGVWQGIFLYIISILIILLSELLIKRKLLNFSHGLTGLGIGALYASTFINYMYMRNFGGIAAIIITVLITVFSFFISRRKDSAVIRMISFIGCYVCFISIARFQNQIEFLFAAGTIFLVNVTSTFFPNLKHNEVIHNFHMSLNTIFIIAFTILARQSGVMDFYIIMYLILNIVLLNIVSLKQEKRLINALFFGITAGIITIILLAVLNDLTHPYQLISQRIYYLLITYVMVAAVSIFFYILNREKMGRAFQYYYFILFTLAILLNPIKDEYIWGMLFLFLAVKIFGRAREYEAGNAIVTVFALGSGLYCYMIWPAWLFFAAALLTIPLIRRFRLFYQYIISLYLIWFIALKTPDYELFLPLAALVLALLVPLFNYLSKLSDIRSPGRSNFPDATASKIYNLTNLAAIAFLSLLCVFINNAFSGLAVTLIGAVSLILYLKPAFYLEFKKRYLLLAAYLTLMLLIIRFPNPIYSSAAMMIIAFVLVITGFKILDKSLRLYGLALAIFACVKIGLYDFRGIGALQQTIVFMVIGTIALAISIIYSRLEKIKNAELKTLPNETELEIIAKEEYNNTKDVVEEIPEHEADG